MPYKNPEDIKAHSVRYYQEHKEEIRQRKEKEKQYRLANKENIAERENKKFDCECGGCYTRKNKLAHERGKAHIYWSKTGINVNTLEICSNWHQHLKELLKED